MALPEPEPGLVISYAYLWHQEHESGQEEGRRDRPCVIVLAVERASDGATVVTVLPITHRAPDDPTAAVEIPRAVKQRLDLDLERSWIVVSEGNKFVWPGFDLRKVQGTDRFDNGFLPPRFFNEVLAGFRAWRAIGKSRLTARACTGILHRLGHSGVFSGKRWENQVYPILKNMILSSD